MAIWRREECRSFVRRCFVTMLCQRSPKWELGFSHAAKSVAKFTFAHSPGPIFPPTHTRSPTRGCFVYNRVKHCEQGVPNKSVINTTHAIKCFRISSLAIPKVDSPERSKEKRNCSGVSNMQTVSHLFPHSSAAPF